MTVIVPDNYHARKALESNRVTCIAPEEACKQDIRPLRIGLLALPPLPQSYELSLIAPLGLSIMQIVPVWLKLKDFSAHDFPEFWEDAQDYSEATSDEALDGLIVSASPDFSEKLEALSYKEELSSILRDAQKNCPSVLALGKAASLLAELKGFDVSYQTESLGLFRNHSHAMHHPVTGELDDEFCCPQHEHSCFTLEEWETAEQSGELHSLVHTREHLPLVFETPDHHFVMHTGYPEYTLEQLLEVLPSSQKAPDCNRWRTHRNDFFSQWLKYCYNCISI